MDESKKKNCLLNLKNNEKCEWIYDWFKLIGNSKCYL